MDAPVLALNVPLALVSTTFITHVVSEPNGGGLRMGSGGPKKQFASSAQEPLAPPQLRSAVHAGTELLLTQCLPGPAPTVQLAGPVPLLPVSVPGPLMLRNDVAASGILPPATTVALPPPKYRQPRPRSASVVLQAVLLVRVPEVGSAGGVARPAGPQLVVPTAVVNASFVKATVVVVVVEVVVLVVVGTVVVVVCVVVVVLAAVVVVVVAKVVVVVAKVVVVVAKVVVVVGTPVVVVLAPVVVVVVLAAVVVVVPATVVVVVLAAVVDVVLAAVVDVVLAAVVDVVAAVVVDVVLAPVVVVVLVSVVLVVLVAVVLVVLASVAVVVVGAAVVVVVPAIVVVVVVGAPHASQQLDVCPTDAEPPTGARHDAAPLRMLQRVLPLASVRQQVTKPGRPHVDCASQLWTSPRHSLRRLPSRIAAFRT